MDWTIVASVLVALLLWPLVMGLVGALVFIPITAIFRGRVQRLMDQKMAHCREMFSSRDALTPAGPAVTACCGSETPERT